LIKLAILVVTAGLAAALHNTAHTKKFQTFHSTVFGLKGQLDVHSSHPHKAQAVLGLNTLSIFCAN
jgi:hypothetical protein